MKCLKCVFCSPLEENMAFCLALCTAISTMAEPECGGDNFRKINPNKTRAEDLSEAISQEHNHS